MSNPAAAEGLPLTREVGKIFDVARRERQKKKNILSPSLLLRKIQPLRQRGPKTAYNRSYGSRAGYAIQRAFDETIGSDGSYDYVKKFLCM